MNPYMKVFTTFPGFKLCMYPSVNNVSWKQAMILKRLNELFKEHYMDLATNQPSDFFLPKLVNGMICTNVESAEFYNDGKNPTYIEMVSSGLISGGISVRVRLVNDNIIMTFSNNPLDVAADIDLVVYIQAVSADMKVLPLLPDMDKALGDMHLAASFFATGLIEIDPAVHVFDYTDLVTERKRMPHYVELFNELGIDPLKYLGNAAKAKELWETVETIYTAAETDSGLFAPNYGLRRNTEGFWEMDLGDQECVVSSIVISEPELLISFHPNGYAINRRIALKRAGIAVDVPMQLSK